MMRHLRNSEIYELSQLLKAVFKTRNELNNFLLSRLDRRVEDFETPQDTLADVITKMVNQADGFLWWPDLVREARNRVPGDEGLAQFAAPFGLAPDVGSPAQGGFVSLSRPQLELKIRDSGSSFDILRWRSALGEIEGRVCRIEYPSGVARGTGFLIGPNAVMTNYHVIEGIDKPQDVRLRFDYKVLDDGVAVGKGLVYSLQANWLYDASPYSPEDSKVVPRDPKLDELDYAILRVEGTPGADFVGGKTVAPDQNATPRGWITPFSPYDFLAQRALYIVEHPEGKPMQVVIDSDAIVGVNGNGTRVRYTTETQPGSSGSPCFSANWEWVAIHHSGDPKYLRGARPEFNQGIPVAAIRNLLQARNKLVAFGGSI
jgi:V8-like Glu-specific endopeptidase